jgi:hypothetical protein
MSFNTRPSTINEINDWVSKRLTNCRAEMKRTKKGTPEYDYLLEREAYLQKFIDARVSLIGKELPENKRNAWMKKLDKL